MLILTRRKGDTILIGDNVVITITNVNGSSVKVGIEAPKEISVIRGELPVHSKTDSMPSNTVKSSSVSKSSSKEFLKKIAEKVSKKEESEETPDIEDMMQDWGIRNS